MPRGGMISWDSAFNIEDLLGDLEGPEEPDTPEDGHAEGRNDLLGQCL
jgi:hypothetical protein